MVTVSIICGLILLTQVDFIGDCITDAIFEETSPPIRLRRKPVEDEETLFLIKDFDFMK